MNTLYLFGAFKSTCFTTLLTWDRCTMHPGRFSAAIAHAAIESCVHFAAYAGSGRSELNHVLDTELAGCIGVVFPAINNKFNILIKNNKDKVAI